MSKPCVGNEVIVPISAIEHYVYCPRQCGLIHVDGMWTENEHTVRGTAGHARVDTAPSRKEHGFRILRHLALWSEEHGLTGRADVVTISPTGEMEPVEYKIGTRHGDAATLQLCAQALCLEEMFRLQVASGSVWYSAGRHRTRVTFDPGLRGRTLQAVDEIRTWMMSRTLPPAVLDARCRACQFLDQCQPRLSSQPDRVARYMSGWVRCAS